MPELTAREQEWVRVQEELRRRPEIEVLHEYRGDVRTGEPRGSENGRAIDVPLRFRGIGSQWQTAGPGPAVTGEFYLDTPSADEGPRDYVSTLDSSSAAEAEERIGRELRVIDSAPYTGTGSCGAIRPIPGNPEPEVWFDDSARGLWRMDLDYSGYLDGLRLTKGAFGWQHLFTRAPLGDWEFGPTMRRLETMLDVLPRIFPRHDYGPLRERLKSRLHPGA